MTHDEAAPLLPELLRGGLQGSVRADLAAHFQGCDECRSLSETYGAIAAALRCDPGGTSWAHPASRDIVAYAIKRDALAPADLGQVEEHLRECSPCRGEVETTRRAHAATGMAGAVPFAPGAHRPGPNARAALAAAAVLAVFAYPAYLGLFRLPAAGREAEVLRQAGLEAERDRASAGHGQESEWGGAVDLHVLESAPRGGGSGSRIAVAPGQPFVLLAVMPSVPQEAPPAQAYRFTIEGPQRDSVWSLDLTAARIREQVRSSGVVTLALPADRLPAARYRMLVARADADPGRYLLQVPFEIAGEGPP